MYKLILFLVFTANIYPAAKYMLKCKPELLSVSGKIAGKQIGMLEKGENRGEMTGKYLASVGLRKALPYCAAGQYWCFAEACKKLHLSKSKIPLPRTGLANAMFNYAKRKGNRYPYLPLCGDMIVWRHGKTIYGHIERIISVGKAGWIHTIGFNTIKYINGQKKEGVFVHKRNIYHFLGLMRIRGLIGFDIREGK